MQIFRHYTPLPTTARGAVVALGNFDGVHRGHQAVLGAAREQAQALGAPLGVVTFEPHPRSLFRPDDPPFRLTPFRVKAHCLADLGASLLFCLHFDRAFSMISAEDFVRDILVGGLAVRHVVIGWDYVFGRGRGGDAALLKNLADQFGFGITTVDPFGDGNGTAEPVSATRIRQCLEAGDAKGAAHLLGRAWEIDGRVEHGDKRGRTLGFPTANVLLEDYQRPRAGVYAVRVGLEEGAQVLWHDGVANIGTRPTVHGLDLRLEAHLFDFDGDLYGRHVRVALIDWIRPEQKFAGLDALKAQIAADADAARKLLRDA
ncbi:MAG TPA: bifunctional riboflavin kinase/FAD synthetase [Stellaceae bacterium]|jgi:riboflavin kinase/FMN adenylyltransferase|nr:bifunctional riboflavin kinase/FAD synthetase [Stellaceae bacterium]